MCILRLLLKILLSPAMLILQLIEWIGIFLVSFGGTILCILSGIIFLIAAASCILQTASGTEVLKMLIISLIALAPQPSLWGLPLTSRIFMYDTPFILHRSGGQAALGLAMRKTRKMSNYAKLCK